MNVLRRVLLAFYSILLAAAAGGLIALVWNQDKKLDLTARHFNVQAFITSSTGEKWAFIVVMGLVIIFGLLTLVVAFVQGGPSSEDRPLKLHQTDGGTVEVTSSALEALLSDQLEALPLITRASPHVRLRAGAVESDITVTTDPGASIATVTAAVAETTAKTFKELVGVSHIRRPHVRIQHEAGGAAVSTAAPPIGAPPADEASAAAASESPAPAENEPVTPAT